MLFTIFRQKQAFFRGLFSPGALKPSIQCANFVC
jgi:hypothetical protein